MAIPTKYSSLRVKKLFKINDMINFILNSSDKQMNAI